MEGAIRFTSWQCAEPLHLCLRKAPLAGQEAKARARSPSVLSPPQAQTDAGSSREVVIASRLPCRGIRVRYPAIG